MSLSIHPIKLGPGCCYLIRAEGTILIDGGSPNQAQNFRKNIEALSLKPEDIKLVVLTHAHWDHVGSVREIKELTGAKIALHRNEKDWLEKGLKNLPPAVTLWGRIFHRIMALWIPLIHVSPAEVDITLEDEDFSLAGFGIPGKIVPTPGHSSGSVSVLLETGDAFVGDLAMNGPPMRLGPGLPIFAEDLRMVKESWWSLLGRGAKNIYPAHGKPFPVDAVRKTLLR